MNCWLTGEYKETVHAWKLSTRQFLFSGSSQAENINVNKLNIDYKSYLIKL